MPHIKTPSSSESERTLTLGSAQICSVSTPESSTWVESSKMILRTCCTCSKIEKIRARSIFAVRAPYGIVVRGPDITKNPKNQLFGICARCSRKSDWFSWQMKSIFITSCDIMTTTWTLVDRIRTNLATWNCTSMFSEHSRKLKLGRLRKNDLADMWHILKSSKNCYFCYTLNLLYIKVYLCCIQNRQNEKILEFLVCKENFTGFFWCPLWVFFSENFGVTPKFGVFFGVVKNFGVKNKFWC